MQAFCRQLFLLCLIVDIATCYVAPCRVESCGRLRIDAPRHRAVVARLLPEPVEKLLPAAARDDLAAVVPLWKALRQCYATEEAALAALRVNPALAYPWVSSAGKIKGSYAVIVRAREGREEEVEKQRPLGRHPLEVFNHPLCPSRTSGYETR